jgi:hypothetical protein
MAKEKQHIFSARTTEGGLRQLNEVKNRLKLSWDDLVICAVCEKYGLGKAEKIVAEPPVTEDKADEKAKNQGGKKVGGKGTKATKKRQKVEQGN